MATHRRTLAPKLPQALSEALTHLHQRCGTVPLGPLAALSGHSDCCVRTVLCI